LASPDPRLRPRRSLLFVPGTRPDRFAKALASGADSVCLDLEDGVATGDKERAREEVAGFLAARASGGDDPASPELLVRVNGPASDEGRRDVEALVAGPLPDGVMVPKADAPDVLEALGRALAGLPLLPLVETPLALHRAEDIARVPGVAALLFGGMDLAAELGARFAWEPLLHARSRMVLAAALGGVGALDVPFPDLADEAGLREEALRVAGLGFVGKLAVHPAQVPHLNRAFTPSGDELERALRIVEVAASATEGVFVVDGRMVDRPVVESARRTVARARSP